MTNTSQIQSALLSLGAATLGSVLNIAQEGGVDPAVTKGIADAFAETHAEVLAGTIDAAQAQKDFDELREATETFSLASDVGHRRARIAMGMDFAEALLKTGLQIAPLLLV